MNLEDIKIIDNLSPERWQEYKDLRIQAVTDVPQAFRVTPVEEKNKEDSAWIKKLELALKNERSFAVFAEANGKLVGMMWAYVEPLEKAKHIAHIVSVYVDKEYRGIGVSTKLLEALIEKIKINKDVVRLELSAVTTQESAVALYKKFGFEIVGTVHKQLLVDSVFYDEYIMEKFI